MAGNTRNAGDQAMTASGVDEGLLLRTDWQCHPVCKVSIRHVLSRPVPEVLAGCYSKNTILLLVAVLSISCGPHCHRR